MGIFARTPWREPIKVHVSYLCYLNESLSPPPTLLLLGTRTHPVGTRTHRTHANVPCVDGQAVDGILDVGHCSVMAVCVGCPLPCNCRWHAGCMQAPACVAHLHAQRCSLGLHFILARRLCVHLVLACQRFHGRMWLCQWLAWRLWGVQGDHRAYRTGPV